MRRMISRVYKALSIVIIVVGMIMLIVNRETPGNPGTYSYSIIGLVIIVDVLLLCIITFVNSVRKGGSGTILQMLRSMRFRLTLWYVALLALMLFVFGSIIYATEEVALASTLDTFVLTRLTQVVSTYNAQTGRLTLAFDENRPQNRNTDSEIVLLITPQGNVLQSSGNLSEQERSLVSQGMMQMAQRWMGDPNWPHSLDQSLALDSSDGTMGAHDVAVFSSRDFSSYNLRGLTDEFAQAAIINQQQQVVALLVVGTPSTVSSQLQRLLSILEIASPLILLLSSAGGYWLAGRAMHPVQTITRTAQQIGETDLHRRLKLKQRDELGELGATFDHMLDRLEAAFERQRQFTADASHELRTPLSIVDLEATRALAQELTLQQYRQTITIMQQENRHMSRLVNDLLVLARADSGQAKLIHEEIDLSEVVVDTVEYLAPLTEQTGIAIKMAPLPELTILGDRPYLTQLLTNIVENALKYCTGIGTQVDIDLASQYKQGQEWARLRISDDGPGIAEEHLPHIFERFYRVDQARTHSQELIHSEGTATARRAGSGLGLSIARWIAQAHGGEIQVRSDFGHGSVFEIWLPLMYSFEIS